MAFKSEAQKRKLAELVKTGKLSKEFYDGMDKDTAGAKIPERVKPAAKHKKPETKVRDVKVIK